MCDSMGTGGGLQMRMEKIKSLLASYRQAQPRREATHHLEAIVNLASQSLVHHDASSAEIAELLYQRGQAQLELFRHKGNEEDLNAAIDDLRMAPHDDGRARVFLDALLEKSWLLKDIASPDAASLLVEAKAIVDCHPSKVLRKDYADKVRGNLADSRLRVAIATKDRLEIERQCEVILNLQHVAFRFALPVHYAALVLLSAPPDERNTKLLERILMLLDGAARQPGLRAVDQTRLSSHAASLALALGKEHMEMALEHQQRTVESSPELRDSPFKCSIIGRLLLESGKRLLKSGNEHAAVKQIVDAIHWLKRAIELAKVSTEKIPEFDLAVVHGCLGDAYVRLQSVQGTANLGYYALKHYERALRIGNPPPESIGLMGDAHFRIGRKQRDPKHLKKAIACKKQAAELYPATRESWSQVGAAAELLFTLEHDEAWLYEAVVATANAHKLDPAWPWPSLQLARIAAEFPPTSESVSTLSELLGKEIQCSTTAEYVEALRVRAVDLAIRTKEIAQQVLGGRTRVFVLDDEHRLMSSTIVLKSTYLKAAQTEMASTRAFAKFISERGLGERFQLPTPLAVKAVDAVNAIYAMERLRGETLAERMRGMRHRGAIAAVTGHFKSALEFLAAYQAWRLEGSAPTESKGFDLEVSDSAKALGVSRAAPDDFFELASRCIPDRVSLLPKKDAHPGNWLVLDSGLSMIDLEATGLRPLCYEVAQLIDDHPAIEPSDAGFEMRIGLVEHYVAEVRKFTVPSAVADDAKSLYPFCWVLRCAYGVGYCRRHYRSAELKERAILQARRNHYEASLDFIANRFGSAPIGLFASKVRLLASQVV